MRSFYKLSFIFSFCIFLTQLTSAQQIVGPDYIINCSQPTVYSLSGYIENPVWTVTGALEIVGSSEGAGIYVIPKSITTASKFSGTISVNGTNLQKTIAVGGREVQSISGSTNVRIFDPTDYTALPYVGGDPSFRYEWFVSPSGAHVGSSTNRNIQLTFDKVGQYLVGCRAVNSCDGSLGTPINITVTVYSSGYTVNSNVSKNTFDIKESQSTNSNADAMMSYTVYNQSTGKLVKEGKFPVQGTTLDLNDQKPGVYLIRIDLGVDQPDTHRVIVK